MLKSFKHVLIGAALVAIAAASAAHAVPTGAAIGAVAVANNTATVAHNAATVANAPVVDQQAAATGGCYSSGVRVGTIQKLSAKGVLSKSWEGELVQDGLHSKSDSAVSNVWKFSVLDPGIANKLDEQVFEGHPVAIKYCQKTFRNPLVSDTGYIVTDVIAR